MRCVGRQRHLLVQELRRPAAEENGTASNAVSKSWEAVWHVGNPRQPPDFRTQESWILGDRARGGYAQHGEVLNVLRQQKRSRFNH